MDIIVDWTCCNDCPLGKNDPDWCLHCDLDLSVLPPKLDDHES